MKRVIVVSLGGSLIVPGEIDVAFLKKFRKTITENLNRYKFVVVCGGGKVARTYINGLKESGKSEYFQGLMGIPITRLNARFMTYLFGKEANEEIPQDMKSIKTLSTKNDVVFCGALRYAKNETSDATATKLANYFKADFVNLTDVQGLYDKNPKKHKDAKFIPKISWGDFLKMANKEKFSPGQHFVLDQSAAKIILAKKVKTYIFGNDMKNFDDFLKGKKFKGTEIYG